jgi:hypothetical protein
MPEKKRPHEKKEMIFFVLLSTFRNFAVKTRKKQQSWTKTDSLAVSGKRAISRLQPEAAAAV